MKKATHILSVFLIIVLLATGVLAVSSAAEGENGVLDAYPVIDFEELNGIAPGQEVSLGDGRILKLSNKAKVGYSIVQEGSNHYLKWHQGTSDAYIHLKEAPALGGTALAFSVDVRNSESGSPMTWKVELRDFNLGGSSNAVALLSIDKNKNVCIGNKATPIGTLSSDTFQTFTVVADFESMTLDGYLDGVKIVSEYAFSIPTPSSVNGLAEDITPLEWFRSVNGLNWSSSINSAGDSELLIDNIRLEQVDTDVYGKVAVTLYDGTDTTNTLEPTGAYTLPGGMWLDEEGNLVEGQVNLTAAAEFYKVDVDLLAGASVRLNDPAGLRFESTISKAVYDALIDAGYTVEFGTYIFPADAYRDDVIPENAVYSVFTDVESMNEANGVYTYYTSLVNLLDQNYARAFGAISYLTVSRGEEEPYEFKTTYIEEDNARSIYQVAKGVAENNEWAAYTDEQKAVVTGYLDAVVEIAGGEAVTIANYTSPYTVTVEEGKLTVTGAVTAIKAVIVDGTVYTRGWSVEGETLSATLPAASEAPVDPEAPQG